MCHDDDIGNDTALSRRIAFILYLTDEWTDKDGGNLQLYEKDELNFPKLITHSILPELNSFAFFEVTPFSYHRVQEVLSQSKGRYSIS